MSKEREKNTRKEENNIQIEGIDPIFNVLAESVKPILGDLKQISRYLKSVKIPNEDIEKMKESMKFFAEIGQQFNKAYQGIIESIQPLINAISNIKFPKLDIDFSELRIYFYRFAFEDKQYIVNKLYENTIFPPIRYIVENDIKESVVEDCENWILNDKDLKLFYIDSIDKWKDKYSDSDIKRMIEEIKFNFEHDNSYSVCTLIAVLIEYMLKQNYSEKIKSKEGIYSSIRKVLNEKVFEPINIKELYIRFIEENLYASTDKAKEFSRHMTHGDKIEFGNMKSAMNMIFIYDFLQDVMIISEKRSL